MFAKVLAIRKEIDRIRSMKVRKSDVSFVEKDLVQELKLLTADWDNEMWDKLELEMK